MRRSAFIAVAIMLLAASSPAIGQVDVEYVSSCLFHDGYRSLIKQGNYFYCGGENGIQIIDVSDTNHPSFIKNCDYRDISKLIRSDGYMYAIDRGDNTLRIFDISDTLNPSLVSTYETDYGLTVDLAVLGDYAYVGAESSFYSYYSYVDIVDISDPFNPFHRNAINTFILYGGICADGGYLYVLSSWEPVDPSDLRIYDLINPWNPSLVSRTEFYEFCCGNEIKVSGQYAFITGWMGLLVVDISDPGDPQSVGVWGSYPITGIFISDDMAYLEQFDEYNDTILALNISDPANPVYLGELEWEGRIGPFIVDNDLLYFGGHYDRIDYVSVFGVIDFSDPANPESTGFYYLPGPVLDAQVDGDFAFVANGYSGLQAVDVGDPYNPLVSGNVDTEGHARDIFVSDGLAFVIYYSEGLLIFDISEPAEPELAGSYQPEHVPLYVCSEGDYVYLVVARDGLYDHHVLILDVSDPSSPFELTDYDELEYPRHVSVVDNIAYVSCRYSLEIVDVSNPASPVHLSSHPYRNSGYYLFVQGDKVYVAGWPEGLEIFDVSDLENPHLVGVYDSLSAFAVAADGDYAYLSRNEGILLLDVSDSSEPTFVSSYSDALPTNEVILQGDYIYVATEASLVILTLTPTGLEPVESVNLSLPVLTQNHPNPFNASTTFGYVLPRECDVAIDVFDILGRRVKTLISRHQPAGSYSVVWDAADQPSGVYLYQIKAGDYSETKSCLLLK